MPAPPVPEDATPAAPGPEDATQATPVLEDAKPVTWIPEDTAQVVGVPVAIKEAFSMSEIATKTEALLRPPLRSLLLHGPILGLLWVLKLPLRLPLLQKLWPFLLRPWPLLRRP